MDSNQQTTVASARLKLTMFSSACNNLIAQECESREQVESALERYTQFIDTLQNFLNEARQSLGLDTVQPHFVAPGTTCQIEVFNVLRALEGPASVAQILQSLASNQFYWKEATVRSALRQMALMNDFKLICENEEYSLQSI